MILFFVSYQINSTDAFQFLLNEPKPKHKSVYLCKKEHMILISTAFSFKIKINQKI